MGSIKIKLPCYDKGVYSHFKSHERDENTIDLKYNNVNYTFTYCYKCLEAISKLHTDYGRTSKLLYLIFVQSGIFFPNYVKYNKGVLSLSRFDKGLTWGRNSEYTQHKELTKKDSKYEFIYRDSFNTYYVLKQSAIKDYEKFYL